VRCSCSSGEVSLIVYKGPSSTLYIDELQQWKSFG
jgi:hypothetical protein